MFNPRFYISTLIVLLFICSFIAIAEEQKALIEINSVVDTSTITIGDRITYTVSINYSDSLQIEHPGAGINLGQFEIKDYTIFDPEMEEGRIFQQYKYVISVFDTGSFTIPPFPVAYFPKDSIQNYKIIEASAINIYV
ncbi:BatD family protein, partial [Calditrichota bacterium]